MTKLVLFFVGDHVPSLTSLHPVSRRNKVCVTRLKPGRPSLTVSLSSRIFVSLTSRPTPLSVERGTHSLGSVFEGRTEYPRTVVGTFHPPLLISSFSNSLDGFRSVVPTTLNLGPDSPTTWVQG